MLNHYSSARRDSVYVQTPMCHDMLFNPTPVGLLSYQLLFGGGVFHPPL